VNVATDHLTIPIECPACGVELTIPAAAEHTGHGEAKVTFDTSAVHDHIEEHQQQE
jgi:hypothetical protein